MMSLPVTAGAQMRSRTYRIPRPDYKKMGVLVLSPKESREERRRRSEEESNLMKKGLKEAKEMLKED